MNKWLIPLAGQIIRHPITKQPLPADGAECEWTGPIGRFWRRRVKDGSCIIRETLTSPTAVESIEKRVGRKER